MVFFECHQTGASGESGMSMDIWFKAKVDWGEALGLLSDTEAGRFAKALWRYAATGQAERLNGREQMLFALVLADLRREAEARRRLSAVRSEAGRRGGRPRGESNESFCFSEKATQSHKESIEREREITIQNAEKGCAQGGGAACTLASGGLAGGDGGGGKAPARGPGDGGAAGGVASGGGLAGGDGGGGAGGGVAGGAAGFGGAGGGVAGVAGGAGGGVAGGGGLAGGAAGFGVAAGFGGAAGCGGATGGGEESGFCLPLNDGSEWGVGAEEVRQWQALYPAVDVPQALRSMRGWLLANRTRRKTARGIERFVVAWLSREQDRARASPAARVSEQRYGQREYGPDEFGELSPEQLEMLGGDRL